MSDIGRKGTGAWAGYVWDGQRWVMPVPGAEPGEPPEPRKQWPMWAVWGAFGVGVVVTAAVLNWLVF